jgi:hypothetical protein
MTAENQTSGIKTLADTMKEFFLVAIVAYLIALYVKLLIYFRVAKPLRKSVEFTEPRGRSRNRRRRKRSPTPYPTERKTCQ